MRISGNGMNVLVVEEDWKKILPYLADGTLDPSLNPVPTKITDKILVPYDSVWVNLRDEQLRQRVLSLLQRLFTRSYPTSKI